ncbi:hypothetical protein JCM10213_002977 [Rhodosporidiobolus nylandii]
MPFSLPATPPHSPEPPQPRFSRLDSSHRAHRPAQLNLHDAVVTPERLPFTPTFAATPSFNPVVGGSSSNATPTRPSNPRLSDLRAENRGFASLPSTPLRSLDRFSHGGVGSIILTCGDEGNSLGVSAWTWPPKASPALLDEAFGAGVGELAAAGRSGAAREMAAQTTPTKTGANGQHSSMFESFNGVSKPELATRYVLVEGLERTVTEDDLRNLLSKRCTNLSLRGCFTAALRTHGVVVLVFNDVRHAVASVRIFSRSQDNMLRSSDELFLEARCISRDAFEQLHTTAHDNPLLSRSEGVLVFTLRGPTSTPFFTPLPLLASFGEIRSLKVVEEHLHVVEYFDDRCAQQAFSVLDGREAAGVRFGCSFEPAVASTELGPADGPAGQRLPATAIVPTSPAPVQRTPNGPYSPSPFPAFSVPGSPPLSPAFPAFSPLGATFAPSPAPQLQPFSPRDVNSFYGNGGEAYGGRRYEPEQHDRVQMPWSNIKPEQLEQLHWPPAPNHAPPSPAVPASPARFPHSPIHSTGSPSSASPRRGSFPPSSSMNGRNGGGKLKHHSRLSEEFGIVRDDKIPAGNVLNFERIEQGLDMRTTLMLKNIPNKLKDWEVMSFVDEVVGRSYDFFYLRCDYSNDCNVGYGFVNFTSTSALLTFAKARLGTRWNMCGSDKLCIMSFANIQGKASLINHFKNSSVLDQEENRRPKLFVTSGPNAGEPEPFPACDDPIRKARSAQNAQNVGLFPSHKPVFKVAQALKGMHI